MRSTVVERVAFFLLFVGAVAWTNGMINTSPPVWMTRADYFITLALPTVSWALTLLMYRHSALQRWVHRKLHS